jgi:RHS repeat-associated protein
MKTIPFCSLTFLYLPVKIVSNVESSKERTRPEEGSEYTDYESGAYFSSTTKIVKNPEGGEIRATESVDALGRSVRKESPGIENAKIVETTEYNAKGQVVKKSNPYLEGKESPVYTVSEYDEVDGNVTKITYPDGSYAIPTVTGFNEKVEVYSASGELLTTNETIKNDKGLVLERRFNGKSIQYFYDVTGKVTKIRDAENGETVTSYDKAGRKISHTDSNSGTTLYNYDSSGNIKSQKDARNITTSFVYDELNRPTSIRFSNSEKEILMQYDSGEYAKGRLTRVTDEAGVLEYKYDVKGNLVLERRQIDDKTVFLKKEYDLLNRLNSMTYPDGTKLYYHYASTGHLYEVKMDTADRQSLGHSVVKYNAIKYEGDSIKIDKYTGNGVRTEFVYDRIRKHPTNMNYYTKNNHLEKQIELKYDAKGNVITLNDLLNSNRSQTFEYDNQNRLLKAKGKYGEENYQYTDNGNLVKKNQFTLFYEDSKHRHAVTKAFSQNTGNIHYAYDETGNMINRNGDEFKYTAQGRLKEIHLNSSDAKIYYTYDASGKRIKKHLPNSKQTVYTFFNGLYEINQKLGSPETHTLYIRGVGDELVAQLTRRDATLKGSQDFGFSGFWEEYNQMKYAIQQVALSIYSKLQSTEGVLSLLILCLSVGYVLLTLNNSITFSTVLTPVMLVGFLFTNINCGNFTSKKRGEAPWLLLVSGINQKTESIDQPQGGGSSGGGGASPLVPPTGMFFLHPDHLGSINMITDGFGNVITGGNNGGKSSINYKPYGEINRTDSSGPDITKFKYTGQEEDKESGLLYYKARYYDPAIGRFLQADSVVMPENLYGMNRYMYVDGNPVKYVDPSGNSFFKNFATALLAPFTLPTIAATAIGAAGAAIGAGLVGAATALGTAGIAAGAGIGAGLVGASSAVAGMGLFSALDPYGFIGYTTGGIGGIIKKGQWDEREARLRSHEYRVIGMKWSAIIGINLWLGAGGLSPFAQSKLGTTLASYISKGFGLSESASMTAVTIGGSFVGTFLGSLASENKGSGLYDDTWNGPFKDAGIGGHHKNNLMDNVFGGHGEKQRLLYTIFYFSLIEKIIKREKL